MRLVFENPSKEQLKHIRKAEIELCAAGVTFDTGNDSNNNKIINRIWELDWSLVGAKVINE